MFPTKSLIPASLPVRSTFTSLPRSLGSCRSLSQSCRPYSHNPLKRASFCEKPSFSLKTRYKRHFSTSEDATKPSTDDADNGDSTREGTEYLEQPVANEQEYSSLLALAQDLEVAKKLQQIQNEQEPSLPNSSSDSEQTTEDLNDWCKGEDGRSHILTERGRFTVKPLTAILPKESVSEPILELLRRTDMKHIRTAAERIFGGPGFPDGPVTPHKLRNKPMNPMPLHAKQYLMNEINADAYMAVTYPPLHASSLSILAELRKRLGSKWLEDLFHRGGPRFLDVGSAGAASVAWKEVIEAEWRRLMDEGKVTSLEPPGTKTVLVGAENLRKRIAKFLWDATFTTRLPDYVHSLDNVDRLVDASASSPEKKQYDVIFASHMLLQEPEGHRRRAVLNSLWSLLSPDGGVLIFMEKGHPRGFEAIAEARDSFLSEFFIRSGSGNELDDVINSSNETASMDAGGETTGETDIRREREHGMIVAPCTNHRKCPMYLTSGKSIGRKDFCHFSQRYLQPSFQQRLVGVGHRNHEDVEFSYVAVRRGVSLPESIQQSGESTNAAFQGYLAHEVSDKHFHGEDVDHMLTLPRNISPPIKSSGHITLDLCTSEGRIERWTIPKSFGKQAYRDARKARWGDLWALGAKSRVNRSIRLGKGVVALDGGVRAREALAAEKGRKKPRVMEVLYGEGGIQSVQEKGRGLQTERRNKKGRQLTNRNLMKELMEDEEDDDGPVNDGKQNTKRK